MNMLRLTGHIVLVGSLAIQGGCLGPKAIAPTAAHNQENIKNYNRNIAALMAAVQRQAAVQGELQVQIIRNRIATGLVRVSNGWTGAQPTRVNLLDEAVEPMKTLRAEFTTATALPRSTSADLMHIGQQHPLLAHLVKQGSRADLASVVLDGFMIIDVDRRISGELDSRIRTILTEERNAILDKYQPARMELETVDTALQGLETVIAEIREQGQIAELHANGFVTFSQASPAFETFVGAFSDQALRTQVIEAVRDNKGDESAARVSDFLGKADSIFGIIEGLKK